MRLADLEAPRKIRTPAQRKRAQAKAFRPLAIELGWLTYEWNRLHESLGDIFTRLVAGKTKDLSDDNRMLSAKAAWHALTNERSQRDMLQAAVNTLIKVTMPTPVIFGEISWILDKLRALSGRRNDAIHAPLAFVGNYDADEVVEILPLYFSGNPRAAGLRDKSLLDEFRWYRNHLERLADYATSLVFAIDYSGRFALPDRPLLRPRGHFASHAPRRPKNKDK